MWLLHLSTLHFSLLTFKESIRPWHGLQGLAWSGSQLFFQSHFFLNSHPEREREREREQEREREWVSSSIGCLPVLTLTRDWTHTLGMCPDQGYALWPFGLGDDTPTNWATLTRAQSHFWYFQHCIMQLLSSYRPRTLFQDLVGVLPLAWNIPPSFLVDTSSIYQWTLKSFPCLGYCT